MSLGFVAYDIKTDTPHRFYLSPYLWYVLLIYLTIRKQIKHYYWIAILGGIKFFMGLGFGVYNIFETSIMPVAFIIVLIIIGGIFILFGTLYPKRISPDFLDS